MHQTKSIRWSYRQLQRRKHQYPNFESHKINISCVLHFSLPSQYIPDSLNWHTADLLWVPGVFLVVTTSGINLSRKINITKRRSRPCIDVTQTLPGWLISLDAIKHFTDVSYCLRLFFSTVRRIAAGQNHANVILRTSGHGSFCLMFFHITTTLPNEWDEN